MHVPAMRRTPPPPRPSGENRAAPECPSRPFHPRSRAAAMPTFMNSAAGALHAGDESGVHVHLFATASDQEPAAVGPDSATRVEGTGALDLVARSLASQPDLLCMRRRGYADRPAHEDEDRRGDDPVEHRFSPAVWRKPVSILP